MAITQDISKKWREVKVRINPIDYAAVEKEVERYAAKTGQRYNVGDFVRVAVRERLDKSRKVQQ